MNSLNRDNFYEIDEGDSDDEIEEVAMADFERRQMKQAMKESCWIFKKVDKSIKRVLVLYNLLMLGLSADRHVILV